MRCIWRGGEWLILGALSLAACSSSLPRPPAGPVPASSAMVVVPYPPPAARVETIPKSKSEREVWIDGQWEWDGKAWKWLAGAWVIPPAGAYFTRWRTERRKDGQLYFERATWRDRNGHPLEIDSRPETCPAPRAEIAGP